MERLQRIRELEGDFAFSEPAQVITIPREEDRPPLTGTEPCVFARLVSYMSNKLYNCISTQKCDSKVCYGTRQAYCKKELDK